jgi:gluconate 2-dehydrogenase alpha chain
MATTTLKATEVVVVGAGQTASILAWKLGEAGHEVVSIEAGPERWATPDFEHNHDGLRFSARYAMMRDLSRETCTWRATPGKPSLPIRQYGPFHPGQGYGGSATHWSAMLWRYLPMHFEYRTHHDERYGAAKIPEGCTLQDWPIGYDELEPYYDAFEWDIGASGEASNLYRDKVTGRGNPHEGPRSREYPNPPLAATKWTQKFGTACRELGYHPFPQPSGILSRGYKDATGRYRAACLYCGFCTRYGCEVDAKSTPLTTHLPLALGTKHYSIRSGCFVTEVRTDSTGRATGVTYLGADGEEYFQPADLVVLAGYTTSNVRLLLLSRSKAHPDGIGNDRGQVGRHATHQLFAGPVEGVFPEKLRTYTANTSTLSVIFDYQADLFDHSDLDFIGGSMIYSSPLERQPVTSAGDFPLGAGSSGAVPGGVPPGSVERIAWGREWKESLRKWDHYGAVRIQGDSLPYEDHRFDLDPRYNDTYGRPLLRYTFDWTDNERAHYRFMAKKCVEIMKAMKPASMSVTPELADYDIVSYKSTHIQGGAVMGTSPEDSVTNSYGQVWDTPNVLVTGAALFPFQAGENPTGTVAALAYRTGDALVDRYFSSPGRLL